MGIYPSIFELFVQYIETDSESYDKKSSRLKNWYNNAEPEEKKITDNLFITMCGYSLRHIVDKTTEDEV